MTDDLVRNEVNALRHLSKGITRYAEQVREALSQARRDILAMQRKAEGVLEVRRSTLQRAERELSQAKAALAQCRESGELQQRVRVATQWHAEAKPDLDRARRAAQTVEAAQSDLVRVLQTSESAVGEQSSVASSALASLAARLEALPHMDVGHAVHNLAVGTAVGLEIFGATMNLGRVAGNALQAGGIDTPLRDQSISEMVEHDKEEQQHYVIEQNAEREKRVRSGEDRETTP